MQRIYTLKKLKLNRLSSWLIIGVICCTLLCSSCREDPGPGQIDIFELEVLNSYPTGTSDNWIIITNTEGEAVANASFESGETVELMADSRKVSDLINVTLVIHNPEATSQNGRDYYYFNSYTDIALGSKWYLKRAPSLPNQEAGKVAIDITNLPGQNYDMSISSFNRRNGVISSWNGSTFRVEVNLRKSPSDLFLSMTGSESRYLKIDASGGEALDFDYNADFHGFDNLIPIQFSAFNFFGNIQGFSTAMGETATTDLNNHVLTLYSGNTNQLKVGFNNGYSFYLTNWSATVPVGRRLAYYKLGDPPDTDSFQPMEALDFTMQDKNINSIGYVCSQEFEYCIHEWFTADALSTNSPVVSWQTARPATSKSPVLIGFPDEMLNKYPYLESVLAVINYQRSTFVMNINGATYDKYIEERFESASFRLFPRESFSLGKGL